MTDEKASPHDGLDAQSRALLDDYQAMVAEWAERLADGSVGTAREFANAVFARFRGAERDGTARFIDFRLSDELGELPARLYIPDVESDARLGMALFLHGGGWSYGGVKAYDGLVGSLAALSGAAVLSLEYRLAPEYPFPIGLEDARRALTWMRRHAYGLGCDPARFGVVGDSAGGNLAAVLARDSASGGCPLKCQALLYPMTDVASPHERFGSRGALGDGRFFLMQSAIDQAREAYLCGGVASADDPRVSPLLAEVPANLPPALIVTASHDPLRDEAIEYYRKLDAAGIDTVHHAVDGTVHAFMSFGVLDSAQEARKVVGDYLRQRLGEGTAR